MKAFGHSIWREMVNPLTHPVSRDRLPLLFIALLVGFTCALGLQHRCLLGLKWLETNALWFLPLLFSAAANSVKRLWIAVLLVAALFLLVTYCVVPMYFVIFHSHGEG